MTYLYQGKGLLVATAHGKERAIAPVFEQILGMRCEAPAHFDTDRLGTFSGEVARHDDPLSATRQKCQIAMEQFQARLCVASEGSFGPHPAYYFIPADEEWLLFMDAENDIEVSVSVLSTQTNFAAEIVRTQEELLAFAQRALFPSHALILRRPEAGVFTDMKKGIADERELLEHFAWLQRQYGAAHVETDMRAMHNPTRMEVIRQAAEKLAQRIATPCPACSAPGYGVIGAKAGLPCVQCGRPTRSIHAHVLACQRCAYKEERLYPHGRAVEDAMYCDFCNP